MLLFTYWRLSTKFTRWYYESCTIDSTSLQAKLQLTSTYAYFKVSITSGRLQQLLKRKLCFTGLYIPEILLFKEVEFHLSGKVKNQASRRYSNRSIDLLQNYLFICQLVL